MLFALLMVSPLVLAQSAKGTVWSGVYTDTQAERGRKAFSRSCAGCHHDDLSGGDDNQPALQGPNFTSKWDGATLAELYDFIASNMPKSNPGSLPLSDCVDVVSFVLKTNGVPSGQTELTTDIKALEQIVFTAKARP
ncbi:MAG TPA: c-type cytochrome [Vicinamibacterales bacterium]|nr:c-type cytochrome [Vicinamibacterales bacterium]